jgi:hypothetical protein
MSRANYKSCRVSQVTAIVWTNRFVVSVKSVTATAKLYLCLLILLSEYSVLKPRLSRRGYRTAETVS